MTFELRLARPAEQEQPPQPQQRAGAAGAKLHLVAGSIHDDALLASESFAYGAFPSPLVLRLTTRVPPAGKVCGSPESSFRSVWNLMHLPALSSHPRAPWHVIGLQTLPACMQSAAKELVQLLQVEECMQ